MIVLDTNVVSELIRIDPQPSVLAWVDAQASAELRITALTAAELRAWVTALPAGKRKRQIANQVDALVEQTFAGAVLAFDVDSSAHYADVLGRRTRAGRPISAVDAQVAAICRQHQAVLATRDSGRFANTGVDVVDPWTALADR